MATLPPLSSLGEAALNWAGQGYFVFPIVPFRKAPALIADYYKESSCDPAQISAWWSQHPNANIGLDCGKSKIVAIDVDSAAGHGAAHDGMGPVFTTLQLLSGGRKAWETRLHATPTGGLHYLFEAPDTSEGFVKTSSDTFGMPGVDTRSNGGYVVLPPSSTPEGSYTVSHDRPLRRVPRKLLSTGSPVRDESGRTAIEAKLADGELVRKGGRDQFLIAIAGKLRDQGFNKEEIKAAIKASYQTRCSDDGSPFDESDFERLANSAAKYTPTVDVPGTIASKIVEQPLGIYNIHDESFAIPTSDFLATFSDTTEWIVDQILQTRSINMSMGAPKAGKSTLLRHLAFSVAYGRPFLGKWKTTPGRVLYYSMQEHKPHLQAWLHQTLTETKTPYENIPIDYIFRLTHKGIKALKGLRARLEEHKYSLVIVDMFNRFVGVENINDYGEVDAITSELNEIAQDHNTCIIWSHHETKTSFGDAFAGAIGSQAIRGSVYTTLKHWKDHGRRYIATEQRTGGDVPSTIVHLDGKTNDLRVAGSGLAAAIADHNDRPERIAALLSADPNITVRQAKDAVGGRFQEVESILKKLRGS